MNRPTIRIETETPDAPHYIEQGDACYILVRLNAPDEETTTYQAVYVLCNCPQHCLIPCGKHGKAELEA